MHAFDRFAHPDSGLGQKSLLNYDAPSLARYKQCLGGSRNQSHALLGMHSEVRMRCLAAKPREGGREGGEVWSVVVAWIVGVVAMAWPGLPGLLRAFRAHPA